jgi:dipeptidase D
LSQVAQIKIDGIETLKAALKSRIEFFNEKGCRASDHGLDRMVYAEADTKEVDKILKAGLKGKAVSADDAEKFAALVKEQEALLKNELHASDAGVSLEVTAKGAGTAEVLDATSKVSALHALNNIPNGIQAYSMDIEGLVETSLNMGIMTMDGESLKMSFAIRSSIESAKHYLTDRTMLFVDMLGGSCEIKGDYPGWAYNPNSELRETFIKVYREMYGKEPVVEAIHAGLECGLFTKKIDGLDSISIGPNMQNVHTSEESLEVGSVQRIWEFLCRVIAQK